MSAQSVLLCARPYQSDTHALISISPSFHLTFLQAQCSDFPQYEIIEQAPKGGDEENMEEGTEGEVKEVRTEREWGAIMSGVKPILLFEFSGPFPLFL